MEDVVVSVAHDAGEGVYPLPGMHRERSSERSTLSKRRMTRQPAGPTIGRRWLLKTGGLVLALLGCTVGLAVAVWRFAGEKALPPTPTAMPTAVALPERDVPGADLAMLPRYPGAVRVAYRHAVEGGVLVTGMAYLADAEIDAVRYFYREVFLTGGWSEGNVGFSQGRWTFFVIAGQREAVVTIESRGPLVEIGIKLSEPSATPTRFGTAGSSLR